MRLPRYVKSSTNEWCGVDKNNPVPNFYNKIVSTLIIRPLARYPYRKMR